MKFNKEKVTATFAAAITGAAVGTAIGGVIGTALNNAYGAPSTSSHTTAATHDQNPANATGHNGAPYTGGGPDTTTPAYHDHSQGQSSERHTNVEQHGHNAPSSLPLTHAQRFIICLPHPAP